MVHRNIFSFKSLCCVYSLIRFRHKTTRLGLGIDVWLKIPDSVDMKSWKMSRRLFKNTLLEMHNSLSMGRDEF